MPPHVAAARDKRADHVGLGALARRRRRLVARDERAVLAEVDLAAAVLVDLLMMVAVMVLFGRGECRAGCPTRMGGRTAAPRACCTRAHDAARMHPSRVLTSCTSMKISSSVGSCPMLANDALSSLTSIVPLPALVLGGRGGGCCRGRAAC